jgi:hypothetical protein
MSKKTKSTVSMKDIRALPGDYSPEAHKALIEFAKERFGEAEVQRLVDLNPFHLFYQEGEDRFRLYRPGKDPTPDCCRNGYCERLLEKALLREFPRLAGKYAQ